MEDILRFIFISTQNILKSIENSDCYGVYHHESQIGFARVVSDEATVYYLCDVFVLKDYNGQGIGKKLVEVIVNSEKYKSLKGFLGTLDAHGLYEQYGFVRDSERLMRRVPKEIEE